MLTGGAGSLLLIILADFSVVRRYGPAVLTDSDQASESDAITWLNSNPQHSAFDRVEVNGLEVALSDPASSAVLNIHRWFSFGGYLMSLEW